MATTLVGRQPQLRALVEAREKSGSGEPGVVLVGGPAGMGKTRLVAEFLGGLGGEPVVLRTACVEMGSAGVPLVPVVGAVRELVATLGLDELARLVPQARVLARLLPEHRESEDTAESTFAELFVAVLHRLGRDRLVVWVVEDAHWADRSTRDLLALLARTSRSTRLLIVVTHRDDLPPVHPWRQLADALTRLDSVVEVAVDPLGRAQLVELFHEFDPERLDELLRRSEGVPFYALELASYPSDELPSSLQSALVGQLARLGEDALAAARVVAVGSRVVEHELVERVAELSPQRLTAALREGVAARILETEGDGYTFRHALLREAVLAELLPVERDRLHRDCATALGSLDGPPSMQRSAEIAIHWLRAGSDEQALPALVEAADAAGAMHAYAERAQLLDHALRLWPDQIEVAGHTEGELYAEALAAGQSGAEYALILRLTTRGLARPAVRGDRSLSALVLAERALAQQRSGYGDAMATVLEARATLPGEPTSLRHVVLERLATVSLLQGRRELALELTQEARRVAESLADPVRTAQSGAMLAWISIEEGNPLAALAALEEIRPLVEASPDPLLKARYFLNRALVPYGVGDLEEARSFLDRGLALLSTAGLHRTLQARMLLERSDVLMALGHWAEAEAGLDEVLAADPSVNDATAALAARTELHLARGDLASAAADLRAARAQLGDLPPVWYLVGHEITLALREDRRADVRRQLQWLLENPREPSMLRWSVLLPAAEAAAVCAPDLLEGLAALAAEQPSGTPHFDAYRAHLAAIHSGGSWAAAAEAWRAVGHRAHTARCELAAAQEALANGDRDAARRLAEATGTTAAELGATVLADQVDAFARAARLSSKASDSQPLGLSPRELQILALLAEGRSNRQIGEALFISPKTVSVHVSNVLAKLGAANRGEAAAIAFRHGLLTQQS